MAPRRPAWALLATTVLVVSTLAGPRPSLSDSLGDTDDAVRLVSVRELLAGAPWFDTTLPRIGAPEPLVSHWSRLIDAPLGAMITAFSPLLGTDGAELATRILWPALLFFMLALIVAARHAGAPGRWPQPSRCISCQLRPGNHTIPPGPDRPPQRTDPMRRSRPPVPFPLLGRQTLRLDRWRPTGPRSRNRLRGNARWSCRRSQLQPCVAIWQSPEWGQRWRGLPRPPRPSCSSHSL